MEYAILEYVLYTYESNILNLNSSYSSKVLKREEFEARKQAAEASRLSKRSQQK